ncbi:MAG: hypothetical protein PHD81_04320 [Candidatus Nanoarchaeia archaeon]|nr:hypothetical protein [Candidatus Nanoarchaeia archaeon]MDD5588303.1 hypothetical protein [Candidatus Nanoarchaeia archaeon]
MGLELEVTKVEGIKTFLNIDKTNDSTNKDYAAFLDLLKLANKRPNWNLQKDAMEHFKKLIEDYIAKIGLEIESVMICVNDTDPRIHCKGVKIISGRKQYLDGYVPTLDFKCDPNWITVCSHLYPEGRVDALNIFTDLLNISPAHNGDGIKKPYLEFISSGSPNLIYISSVEKMSVVLKEIQKVYSNIGKKRFEELYNLKRDSNDISISKLSKKILTEEYDNRIKLLLPSSLD